MNKGVVFLLSLLFFSACAERPQPAPQATIPVAEQSVQDNSVIQDNRTPNIAEIRQSAEAGNDIAEYNLGVAFNIGEGVDQSSGQAVYWWLKSARKGLPEAQLLMGSVYHVGVKVSRDDAKALYWWQQAANQGDPEALFNIGLANFQGDFGLEKNDSKAAEAWLKASQRGYAKAMYNLSVAYRDGLGVPLSPVESDKWLRKAAAKGIVRARRALEKKERQGIIDSLG